jgi:hypothetical protein
VILPNEKQDLVRITSQRDAIGRMIRRAQNARTADTPGAPPSPEAPKVEPEKSPLAQAEAETNHRCATTAPRGDPSDTEKEGTRAPEPPDPIQQDPPRWIIENASLSELLLWRLGIPLDREAVEREHAQSKNAIDLKPPITTRKVADAIAHLSQQLMEGKIDANNAKTSLYALQTLLTALRLQIVEEKKVRDAKKKKAEGRKRNAKRKR